MNRELKINHQSEVPKYRQVVELIISDIKCGIFKQGQRIPSINEISEELLLSRDTVEKAYVYLREKGVVSSVRGKGYYVNQVDIDENVKVALIFNKLSNYKRNLYYSFINTLGSKASTDVFIYNYDIEQFESIIDSNINKYDYYVILPHFRKDDKNVVEVIKKIPREKVLLIDRNMDALNDYPIVYQEYEKDIQSALTQGLKLIERYSKINIVFPDDFYYPRYILKGFQIFCQINNFEFSVFNQINSDVVKKGEAYVLITDDDLYRFIKICRSSGFKLGSDVGVVAYNDNPVKELLENGITTVTTNHDEIGRIAAEMILTNNFKRIKSPFEFIKRNSL
ncbi:MAG TPA: GntR family transcriptional regulator [Mariniphaga sp.]|nr:GntR family transcriptional regulator [Mariniphaga sp.]